MYHIPPGYHGQFPDLDWEELLSDKGVNYPNFQLVDPLDEYRAPFEFLQLGVCSCLVLLRQDLLGWHMDCYPEGKIRFLQRCCRGCLVFFTFIIFYLCEL